MPQQDLKNSSAIEHIKGRGLPLPENDVDTDRIIPARYLKFITFEGLGAYAFYDERFDEQGKPKPHPFNDPKYSGATILLAGANFGCGSSREHAPQALYRFGIRAIIAPSFAEIFAGNATAIGMPTVMVSPLHWEALIALVTQNPQTEIHIDLKQKTLSTTSGWTCPVEMNEGYRKAFLEGSWDTTAVLLANFDLIRKKAMELPSLC
ncbi:MAG: 3-isopropylmalate dehydratase small subunit [Spirochaetes bacterium]|nr:3-isopropylmalate dehydratase small subunit [Spirochaetota bacterium]